MYARTEGTAISTRGYGLVAQGSGPHAFLSGNVGIGDTTPDGKLEVRQTAAADIFNLYDDTTNVLTVLDGGNVGIGDTNPTYQLELLGSGTQRIVVESTDNQAGISFLSDSADEFVIYSPDSSSDLRFFSGAADRMTIQSDGDVGIGTTNPGDNELAISADDTNVQLRIINTNSVDTSKPAEIVFDRTAISGSTQHAAVGVDDTSRDFFIWVNGSDRVQVDQAGAVQFLNYGAGTLVTDVSGNITVSSDEGLKDVHGGFEKGLDVLRRKPRTLPHPHNHHIVTEES